MFREFIGSEVDSLVCSSYRQVEVEARLVDTADWDSPVWRDSQLKLLLNGEEGPLVRDRLGEEDLCLCLPAGWRRAR